MSGEIIVIPFHSQGHIFPAVELCNHLAIRNYKITLFLPSSSFLPLHPLIQIIQYSIPHHPPFAPPPNPSPSPGPHFPDSSIADLLAKRFNNGQDPPTTPICAIVDVMMGQLIDTCREFKIPPVSFFTSSACSASLEHATLKLSSEDPSPGQILTVPGLPEEISLTVSDLTFRGPPGPPPPSSGHHGRPPPPPLASGHQRRPPPPPFGHVHPGGPPPSFGPGGPPPRGIAENNGAIALLFNTCDDLERPFLDYVAEEAKKPVWGVGPLLPAQFWAAAGSLLRDEGIRSKHESSVSESDALEWLDAKPRRSVIYVSFGTLVGPSDPELAELAAALEESSRPFIWALQPGAMRHDPAGHPTEGGGGGYFPDDLARRTEGRGLVIRGWAPQLLILSHPSTAGFVTHCGWNSTVEALGCGVPMLTWPVHGDQMHNAKLVTRRLRVGHTIRAVEGDKPVTKDDVVVGIERLMADEEMRMRAASVRSMFAGGFPDSSSASLDTFLDFVKCQSK